MDTSGYDRLNNRGYVETIITDGDVIIGKIQPKSNNNIYKDTSDIYKPNVPSVIETGIYNNEGYEIVKCKIRSERIPTIGDIFCTNSTTTHGILSIESEK